MMFNFGISLFFNPMLRRCLCLSRYTTYTRSHNPLCRPCCNLTNTFNRLSYTVSQRNWDHGYRPLE